MFSFGFAGKKIMDRPREAVVRLEILKLHQSQKGYLRCVNFREPQDERRIKCSS